MQRERGENGIECILFIGEEFFIMQCFSSYREAFIEGEVNVTVKQAWGGVGCRKMGEAMGERL